jgi:hypothetical protein
MYALNSHEFASARVLMQIAPFALPATAIVTLHYQLHHSMMDKRTPVDILPKALFAAYRAGECVISLLVQQQRI